MGEKQTGFNDFFNAANFKSDEDRLVVVSKKAKVLIVCLNDRDEPGIFVATRSNDEETRQMGPDFPGGSLLLGEKPKQGVVREAGSEFPGLGLFNIVKIGKVERNRPVTHDSLRIERKTTTYIFAANAVCPPEGIRLGTNETGVYEHCAASIHSVDVLADIPGMPRKYPETSSSYSGQLAIKELMQTAEPIIIPPELLETRWQPGSLSQAS